MPIYVKYVKYANIHVPRFTSQTFTCIQLMQMRILRNIPNGRVLAKESTLFI